MDYNALKKIWKQDEAMSFKGWDFSYLKHRWQEEPLPWNYEKIIRAYLKPEYRLLYMGTGGGEFLLTLNHPYHNTSVTEMWAPNVKVQLVFFLMILSPINHKKWSSSFY